MDHSLQDKDRRSLLPPAESYFPKDELIVQLAHLLGNTNLRLSGAPMERLVIWLVRAVSSIRRARNDELDNDVHQRESKSVFSQAIALLWKIASAHLYSHTRNSSVISRDTFAVWIEWLKKILKHRPRLKRYANQDNSVPPATQSFTGADFMDNHDSSSSRPSMFMGAHDIVVSGGNFVIDQRTMYGLRIHILLPYSLLALQSTIVGIAIHNPKLKAPIQVECKPPPMELAVQYPSFLLDPYKDMPILFLPLVIFYVWKIVWLYPAHPNHAW